MSETTRPPIQRVAVLIPTYNERDTLPVIVARLREVVPDADLVVLDDNSPDGTGAVADALAAIGGGAAIESAGHTALPEYGTYTDAQELADVLDLFAADVITRLEALEP